MLECSPTSATIDYFARLVLRICYTRSAARGSVAVGVDLMPNNTVDTTALEWLFPNHPPAKEVVCTNARGPSRSRLSNASMTYRAEQLSIFFRRSAATTPPPKAPTDRIEQRARSQGLAAQTAQSKRSSTRRLKRRGASQSRTHHREQMQIVVKYLSECRRGEVGT
jgi:hypothetical protein